MTVTDSPFDSAHYGIKIGRKSRRRRVFELFDAHLSGTDELAAAERHDCNHPRLFDCDADSGPHVEAAVFAIAHHSPPVIPPQSFYGKFKNAFGNRRTT